MAAATAVAAEGDGLRIVVASAGVGWLAPVATIPVEAVSGKIFSLHGELTAIVGHSWGALLGARLAVVRPEISAYVSLGGTFLEFSAPGAVLQCIYKPSLFMFIKPSVTEDRDAGGLWRSVAAPKYRAG